MNKNDKKLKHIFIEEINEMMKRENLSQSELSVKAGVRQSNISRYLNGQVNACVDWLENLVGAAGYDIKIELVKREEDK